MKPFEPVHHPHDANEKNSNFFTIVTAIMAYCSVSIGIIFLNRKLFTDTFPYPVFVSWFQQLFGFAALSLVAFMKHLMPSQLAMAPNLEFHFDVALKIVPLTFCFVGMVGFANTCLKYVQISTYQTARALTLIFNLVLSKVILGLPNSTLAWYSCGVVILGFTVGSLDSSTLSIGGLALGASSSLFQAFYSVAIKKCLPLANNSVSELLYYNLAISSVAYIPVIYFAGEWGGVVQDVPLTPAKANFWTVWVTLSFSGILGVSINLVSYLCIKVTTPVTFNIVGYAKACLQSLGGIILLGDSVTAQSAAGIVLTLAGSLWYSKIKTNEEKLRLAATKIQDDEETGNSEIVELKKSEADQSQLTRLSSDDDGDSPDRVEVELPTVNDERELPPQQRRYPS